MLTSAVEHERAHTWESVVQQVDAVKQHTSFLTMEKHPVLFFYMTNDLLMLIILLLYRDINGLFCLQLWCSDVAACWSFYAKQIISKKAALDMQILFSIDMITCRQCKEYKLFLVTGWPYEEEQKWFPSKTIKKCCFCFCLQDWGRVGRPGSLCRP